MLRRWFAACSTPKSVRHSHQELANDFYDALGLKRKISQYENANATLDVIALPPVGRLSHRLLHSTSHCGIHTNQPTRSMQTTTTTTVRCIKLCVYNRHDCQELRSSQTKSASFQACSMPERVTDCLRYPELYGSGIAAIPQVSNCHHWHVTAHSAQPCSYGVA